MSYHSWVEWTLSLSDSQKTASQGGAGARVLPFLVVGDLLERAERAGVVKARTVAGNDIRGHLDLVKVCALVVPILVAIRVRL